MSSDVTQPIWIPKTEKRQKKGRTRVKTMEEKVIIAGTDV